MSQENRDLIYEWAKKDPTVLAYLQLHARQKVSETEMIEKLLLHVLKEKHQLKDQLIDVIQRTGAEPRVFK